MLLIPTHLLSSENHSAHLTNLLQPPPPPPRRPDRTAILQLHYPVKLSHLAGDVNDSGQGLEAEGMQTFLERMN